MSVDTFFLLNAHHFMTENRKEVNIMDFKGLHQLNVFFADHFKVPFL